METKNYLDLLLFFSFLVGCKNNMQKKTQEPNKNIVLLWDGEKVWKRSWKYRDIIVRSAALKYNKPCQYCRWEMNVTHQSLATMQSCNSHSQLSMHRTLFNTGFITVWLWLDMWDSACEKEPIQIKAKKWTVKRELSNLSQSYQFNTWFSVNTITRINI